MSREGRASFALVAMAMILGVLADVIFHGRPLGIGVLVWTVALVATLALLLRVTRAPLHQGRRWMLLPLLVFAGMFALRESKLLMFVNLVALAGAVSLGALRRTEPRPQWSGVSDYAAGAAAAGFASFAGAVHLLHKDVPWEEAARGVRGSRVSSAFRGVAIGLPLLALFGGLFAAADAVFRNLLADAIPSVANPWTHLLFVAAFAWVSAGLLRDLVAAREEARVLSPAALVQPRHFSLGPVELSIVLAALDVLFLSFVLVQIRYLFGGRSLVEAQAHLTYAQYARQGFFELVAVAVLVLPVLLLANHLVRSSGQRAVNVVRALSAALVALVLVVIASALERMWLYQQEYGLTELRLYTTGVMLWLACVFVWLMLTVLRGRQRRFAVGALVLGFAASLAMNLFDPDALIARTNLSRPHVDAVYLSNLSDDAVPTLVERLPTLKPPLRSQIAQALLLRQSSAGWAEWNLSRSRARHVIALHRAELLAYARE